MADCKRTANDRKKNDDHKAKPKEKRKKRFVADYMCANEDCKKNNKGKEYEYLSNTYVQEYQRKCPKCGAINECHSSGKYVGQP